MANSKSKNPLRSFSVWINSSKSKDTTMPPKAPKKTSITKAAPMGDPAASGPYTGTRRRASANKVEMEDTGSENELVVVGHKRSVPGTASGSSLPQTKRRSLTRDESEPAEDLVQRQPYPIVEHAAPKTLDKKKFSMGDFCSGTLRVAVGANGNTFEYSQAILTRSSDWFRVSCADQTFDSRRHKFDLTAIEPEVFTIWLVWLSRGDIKEAKETIIVPGNVDRETIKRLSFQQRLQLLECYALAERLIDRTYMNYIMDLLVAHCRYSLEALGPSDGLGQGTRLVYEKTRPDSILRRLVLENFLATGSLGEAQPRPAADRGHGGQTTEAFYFDLAKMAMRQLREGGGVPLPPWEKPRCCYHDHTDKPDSYSCEAPGVNDSQYSLSAAFNDGAIGSKL